MAVIEQHREFVVIGGGPGGYSAALRAAELGREVTLVDQLGAKGLGGNCLHEGCIPTKALLQLAERCVISSEHAAAGLRGQASVDLSVFQGWKRGLIDQLAAGVETLLRAAGVHVEQATVAFDGPASVRVTAAGETQRWTFDDIVIAVGSRPLAPPGLPIDGVTVIDSTGALELEEVPESLVVVGGGSVGLELGTVFAKLGAAVTIVEQQPELLPMIDPRLVRPLRRRLGDIGIEVLTAATVGDHADGVALVQGKGGEVRVPAQVILAGVGRRPQTDRLDVAAAGLGTDDLGFLSADEAGVVRPHVAAVGDITAGPFHAHRAAAEGMIAAGVLCGGPPPSRRPVLPFIAHSDPEIASAGVTPAEARAAAGDVRIASFPLRALGWAVAAGQPHGQAMLICDARTDVVLGVHLVGRGATEHIGEGVLAIETGATVAQLQSAVHAHPTFSEQLPEVAHRSLLAAAAPTAAARG